VLHLRMSLLLLFFSLLQVREARGMSLRRGRSGAPAGGGGYPELAAYNIIPIQDVVMHGSHPSLWFPEVRAAVEALAHASDLPPPPLARDWDGLRADLFDWLGATFGFQLHNVRNQREHLVLLLANAQLRAGGTPSIPSDHPADVPPSGSGSGTPSSAQWTSIRSPWRRSGSRGTASGLVSPCNSVPVRRGWVWLVPL
jgi:hypothetical protein